MKMKSVAAKSTKIEVSTLLRHAQGENRTNKESLKLGGAAKRGVRRVQVQFVARHGQGEIGTHAHEQEQGNHLEGQAGNHDINARLLRVVIVGRRGNGTSGRLQNEGEDIETDEGDGINGRAEARNVSAIRDDDAGEADVDGGAEESRGDGEADEVARTCQHLSRFEAH